MFICQLAYKHGHFIYLSVCLSVCLSTLWTMNMGQLQSLILPLYLQFKKKVKLVFLELVKQMRESLQKKHIPQNKRITRLYWQDFCHLLYNRGVDLHWDYVRVEIFHLPFFAIVYLTDKDTVFTGQVMQYSHFSFLVFRRYQKSLCYIKNL